MPRCLWPLLAAAALAAEPALSQGTRLQPGLWDHSFSMKSQSGRLEKALQEMQQALASMPADQRRQMEAMMGQQGVGFGPQGSSVKTCLSKEEAERDQPPPPQDGCTQTARRNGQVWTVSFKCPGDPPSSGTGTVTLVSPTAYSGSFDLVTDVDGRPEKVKMTTQGKWLGAACGNIKPSKP